MKKHQSGFTLIEIMVTLTLLSILLSYGIPNLNDLLVRQSISTKVNDMQVDLAFARSEAINGGTPVSIITDSTWDQGWQIVTDTNRDGENEVLRVSDSASDKIVISDSSDTKKITFNPSGTYKSSEARELIFKHISIEDTKILNIALSGNTNIN